MKFSILVGAVAALAAGCGPEQLHDASVDELDQVDEGVTAANGSRTVGKLSGTAKVNGTKFLRKGVFAAQAYLQREGNAVQGFLDIEERSAPLAKHLTYNFKGRVEGTAISLVLSDRMCGAGDPLGLCYPLWGQTGDPAFRATGTLTEKGLSLSQVQTIREYPVDVIAEQPFTTLELRRTERLVVDRATALAGTWRGQCNLPGSTVYPLPLPLTGVVEATFSADALGKLKLSHLFNGQVDVLERSPEVFLGETFIATENRIAFIEVNTAFGSWLYSGNVVGDTLSVLVASNDFENPYYDYLHGSTQVPDPASIALRDVTGVCTLRKK